MKNIYTSEKIYINKSNIKSAGRGVFANKNIKKGEVIETCPVIKVSEYDMANLNESILVTYFFYFGKHNKYLLIALGFGSIYNHSYTPNAKYKIKILENVMEFIALKAIKKNDEITVSYIPPNSKNKAPLWFELNPKLTIIL